MKPIILIAVISITIPHVANALSCAECDVVFHPTSTSWTDTGTSGGSGYGNYYKKQGRTPTNSSSYYDTCETTCYEPNYVDVYTCSPGHRPTSTGGSGYYGDWQKKTRVYTSTSYFVCNRCPHGSYSTAYGQMYCTLCPGGYTTTGSGSSNCSTAKCSGYEYTETWETPSWSNGSNTTVNNLCKATKCKAGAYLNGTTCTPCPAGTYNPNAGATSSSACISCPTATNIYTDSARTKLAVGTSVAGSASCHLSAGTYYDATGEFEYSSDCSY